MSWNFKGGGEYFHQCVTMICTLWLVNGKIYIASLMGKSTFVKRQTVTPLLGTDHREEKDLPQILDIFTGVHFTSCLSVQGSLNSLLTSSFSISCQKALNHKVINKEKYDRDRGTLFYVCSLAWAGCVLLCSDSNFTWTLTFQAKFRRNSKQGHSDL